MIFRTLLPTDPLRPYVESFTYYKGYSPDHTVDRLLPDGSVHLIIELDQIPKYIFDNETLDRKQKCIHAWVSGMQTRFLSISAEQNSSMFVVRFRAGGSYPFLQLPLSELNDRVVDAGLIFGNEIGYLRERLLNACQIEEKFRLVDNWLLQCINRPSVPEAVVNYAVDRIQKQPGMACIKHIAEKSGYSHSQFIYLFKKHVGLTPKYYHRIIRFNQVLHEIQRGDMVNWSRLAFDCGYYDQAHFIREFKLFSGFNPSRYLCERGEYLNYVPVG